VRPLHLLLSLVLLALAATGAEAQQFGSLFRYNYLEIDYSRVEMDGVGPSVHGYALRGSVESTNDVRVLANWRSDRGSGNTREDLEVGFGVYNSINRQVDGIIDFKYLHSDRQIQTVSKTKDGWGVELGLRTFPHDVIELDLSAEYRALYKDELGGHAALMFYATENISIGVRYDYFSEEQVLEGGVRFSL